MNPTEAEDIKKKQQEYTEELYKTDPHDPDNLGVISPTARYPGMQSGPQEASLRTKLVEGMEFQLSYSKS